MKNNLTNYPIWNDKTNRESLPFEKNEQFHYTPLKMLLEKMEATVESTDIGNTDLANQKLIISDEILQRIHFFSQSHFFDILLVSLNGEFNLHYSQLPKGKIFHKKITTEELQEKNISFNLLKEPLFHYLNNKEFHFFDFHANAELENENLKIVILHLDSTPELPISALTPLVFHLNQKCQLNLLEIRESLYPAATLIQNEKMDFTYHKIQGSLVKLENTLEKIHYLELNTFTEINELCLWNKNQDIAIDQITGNLLHEKSNIQLQVLSLLTKLSKYDLSIHINHQRPETISSVLVKSLAQDESMGTYTGKIFVEKKAQKSEARYLNKNLTLSPRATINGRPQLEIFADDVKCSHGFTCGKIQEEELFYLESRGLNKERANKLLIQAFSQELLNKISKTHLGEFLHGLLKKEDFYA